MSGTEGEERNVRNGREASRVRMRGEPPPHVCRSVSAVRIRHPSRCPANQRPLPQKDSAMSQAVHHWGCCLRPSPLKPPHQKIVFLCSSHPVFQKNSYGGEINPDQRISPIKITKIKNIHLFIYNKSANPFKCTIIKELNVQITDVSR